MELTDLHQAVVNLIKPLLIVFHLPRPAMTLPGINHGVMRIGRRHCLKEGLLKGYAALFFSCM